MAATDPIGRLSRSPLLAAHTEYLRRIARPCVRIALSDTPPRASGSRFGGLPFVPPDFRWPEAPVGAYRFLGQIDFAEIPNPPESLPASGLLTLFFAEDEDGEVFWGDDDYVVGFYWPNADGHTTMPAPKGAANRGRARDEEAVALSFATGLDLPRHRELREDWPFDDEAMEHLADMADAALDATDDHLLGYPTFNTLAYDPTPGDDWISLLTLSSHDRFDWCWHDGDKLMIFIETERLKALDFGRLKTDAG